MGRPVATCVSEAEMSKKDSRTCRLAAVNELCRVCTDKAHGFHFGVMVCRACAAFFRRTVALNMQYHCRFDKNCQVDKSVRCMCRACRHTKCVGVGMKAESVQLNRDSIGRHQPKVPADPKTKAVSVPSSSDSASPCWSSPPSSTSGVRYDEAENEVFQRVNAIFEHALQHPKVPANLSLVEQFQLGYHHLCQRRPTVHTDRFIDTGPEAAKLMSEEELEAAMNHNWDVLMKQNEKEVDLMAELLSYVRPLVLLPMDQRWIVFRHFWLHFVKFERAYETYRVLGDNLEDSRVVVFNGEAPQLMHALMDTGHQRLKNSRYSTMRSLFGPAQYLMRTGVVAPMKQLKPTEFEFACMTLHLLWLHPGSDAITDETIDTARTWRQHLFQQLHDYYRRDIGLDNYAGRLGEFMALLSTVQKNTEQKKENMIIAEVFSIMKINPQIMTVFR